MSERMAAEIMIGGAVPAATVPELCKLICNNKLGPEHDAAFEPHTAEDLLAGCQAYEDAQVLCLYDDQARWGQFAELEAFLEKQHIAFDRFSEGKYDIQPEWVAYRPASGLLAFLTDGDRTPLVHADKVQRALKRLAAALEHLEANRLGRARKALRRARKRLQGIVPQVPRWVSISPCRSRWPGSV